MRCQSLPSPIYYIGVLVVMLTAFLFTVESPTSGILLEWNPLPSSLKAMPIFLLVDNLSVTMLLTVSTVSTSVALYARFYMWGHVKVSGFFFTLLLFVFSMCLLCLSANLFTVMLSWDGLGITSFCLIIYFSNWNSFNSSVTTFLSNRLGDLFLILSITVLSPMSLNSWLPNPPLSLLTVAILLGALSKSAMFPFSAWLPLAMAAPTPVSSLVHSSTLVTAGVYLLIRFNSLLDPSVLSKLVYLAIVTGLVSGTLALQEYDLKKIVAYSTLSHLSLMVLFISLGSPQTALLHLVIHATFKSHIFMLAGIAIFNHSDTQDIRSLSSVSSEHPLLWLMLVGSFLSMSGAPFLSGFYSKELMAILSTNLNTSSWFVVIIFSTLVAITAAYSTRTLYYLGILVPSNSIRVHSTSLGENMLNTLFLNYCSSLAVGGLVFCFFTPNLSNFDSSTMSLSVKWIALFSLLCGLVLALLTLSLSSRPHGILFATLASDTFILIRWVFSSLNYAFSTLIYKVVSFSSNIDVPVTLMMQVWQFTKPTVSNTLNSSGLLILKVGILCLCMLIYI
nr:NADH dehydrogenase subunit 5 [Antarctophthirus lobodontis]